MISNRADAREDAPVSSARATFNRVNWQEAFGLLGLYIALMLFFSVTSKFFLRLDNFANVLTAVAIIGILAVATTAVIVSGGIDLSIGSMVALASVVVAQLSNAMPIYLAVAMALLAGVLVGAINGFAVTRLGINPLIATLGMLSIARGLAFVWSGGLTQAIADRNFGFLARDPLLETRILDQRIALTFHVFVMVALFILGAWVMRRTTFGRAIYAIGGNAQAARLAGLPVRRLQMTVYILSGLFAALGGVFFASQFGAGAPAAATGIELQVIAAVILGGTSLSGGKGTIWGTLLGVLIMGTLNNGLTLMNMTSYYQDVARGIVLLLAVGLDQLRLRLASRT